MAHVIAVAGKGGVGKTTLCGMLIQYLCEQGKGPILAVDADANSNLNEVLGVEVETTLGDVREEIARAELAKENPIPAGVSKADYAEMRFEDALVEDDDFDLLVMGRTQGKGCYCYVGSCFPKDVKALIKTAEMNGYEMRVLKAVEEVNEQQKQIIFKKLSEYYETKLIGKNVGIWGLAFKPETDDMREAPSLVVIRKLLEAGCRVRVYDPIAMDECYRQLGDAVIYATDMYDATLNTDALLLLTEWKQFRLPSWEVIKKIMKCPLIIDGRNIYEAQDMVNLGFDYVCIGR